MAAPKPPRDLLAEIMAGARQTMTPHLAELLKSNRVRAVPSDEERRLFWQRALTPEQEQQAWADEAAARGILSWTPGAPETLEAGLRISQRVYPARWDMLGAEGRTTTAQQAAWALRLAQLGPPEPKPGEAHADQG